MARLLEYLYSDPGGMPEPDHADNYHMARPGEGEDGHFQVMGRGVLPQGDPTAYLDGRGFRFYSKHDLPQGHDGTTYDRHEAIRFRHVLGESEGPPFTSKVTGASYPSAAIRDRMEKLALMAQEKKKLKRKIASKKRRKHEDTEEPIDSIDEVLKQGVQSHSAGDNRAIKALENGKYPGKAEDGKGFCFHWADGRGICGFKFRNDALRWAKAEPRDIVKFWYGEPLHNNGKFRIRVRDRYVKDEGTDEGKVNRQEIARFGTRKAKRKLTKKDESVQTFSDLMEATTDLYKLDAHDKTAGYRLFEVDAAKWNAAWKKAEPSEHVGPGGSGGIGTRYKQFLGWRDQEPLQIGKRSKPGRADEEKIIAPTGFIAEGARVLRVGFDNGRHRFAAMRDIGGRTVVALKPEMAALARSEGLVKREVRESA